MKQIGNYSVERVITTVRNNCIAYEVTPKGNPNVKYTAEVAQINTNITLRKLVEHIHKQNNEFMIVDMFGVRRAERQYLVTVRDSHRKISKNAVGGNGNSFKISASMSRRLMLESVELVKGLHKMGIRMECPFEYFMQKEEGQEMCLSIPKVNNPIDIDNTVGSKGIYKNIGEELSIL